MVQLSGTEHRDQYRTFYDASVGSGSAQKASIAPGPEKTSTMIGLPWCNSSVPKEVPWSHKVWAPVGVAGNVHYRPTSSSIGSASRLTRLASKSQPARFGQVDAWCARTD